jgi:hypothetical protein
MNDREFCDRSAGLAAEAVRDKYSHLSHGAVGYPAFSPGVVLFFGNVTSAADGRLPIVAKLREFLAIEEVGIREWGFGTTPDRRTWAMLAHSRRDVEDCRRLIAKAEREARVGRSARLVPPGRLTTEDPARPSCNRSRTDSPQSHGDHREESF